LAEKDDKTIIFEYLQGDEKSLEFLIKKYLSPIYGFVYKNVGDISAAEDITQEVFVKVWKNLKKFDQEKDFKPWIFQIAKNASIDYLRKKKTIPFSKFENESGQNILTETTKDNSPDLLNALDDKNELQKITEALSKKDRRILDFRHNQGMSFKEIAEIFKESINTTKSRYRRIIIKIRKEAPK
jgi:RNA polymerase sigma-70 factor (ECF subfamily)